MPGNENSVSEVTHIMPDQNSFIKTIKNSPPIEGDKEMQS